MSDVITSVVSVIFVLGIMMVVHEWGHYIVARYFGVRVEVFSFFGLGPRVWGFKRGDTDFRISAIPIGAYVLMAGERPGEPHAGAPDEFTSKPRWQRALIVLAGPVMNILLTVVLFGGLYGVLGLPIPAYFTRPAEVAGVPKSSPAAEAGLAVRDRIVDVNGAAISNWEHAREAYLAGRSGPEFRLTVEREGERKTLVVPVTGHSDFLQTFGYPELPARIDQIQPGLPADRAGLRSEDEIVSADGQPIRSWHHFAEAIRSSGGKELTLKVKRRGSEFTLKVTPVQGTASDGEPFWQIGVSPVEEVVYRRVGPVEAATSAVRQTVFLSGLILRIVGQLVIGKESLRNMQSIVGIARESGQAAKRGPVRLLQLMAIISLNLGILNLLPIPVLDGGLLLMLGLEGLRRKEFSLAVKERFAQVGWVLLLAVFVYVMYNDVLRLLPRR
jgi:regulator of sigma E protease